MSDGRSMDEWLIRYLIVGLVGAVGTLALLYGLTLGESMAVTAGGAVGVAVLLIVLGIDLRQYRAA